MEITIFQFVVCLIIIWNVLSHLLGIFLSARMSTLRVYCRRCSSKMIMVVMLVLELFFSRPLFILI
jgi:hypothetical protein